MTTCPYCNAALAEPAPAICPRCDERLSAKSADVAEAKAPAEPDGPPMWFRLGFFASCVISIIISLFAWRYYSQRQDNKIIKVEPAPSPFGPATHAPLGVPSLGYLPASANIVACVQMNAVRDYAQRTNQSADGFFTSLGLPRPIADELAKAGLPWDVIDQIAVAVELERDNALPTLTVVITTRGPVVNPGQVISQFAKAKSLIVPVTAKWMSETVLMLGTKPERFVSVPQPPGAEHFSKVLRETIGSQLEPSSIAWLATDSQTWSDSPTVKAILLAKPDWAVKDLNALRSLAVCFYLAPDWTVGLRMACDTDANAKRLRDYFGTKGASRPTVVGGEDRWATIDIPAEPAELTKIVTWLTTK